ncbi:MAG: PAS domain S-box protein [Acidobacteria bacterium]|nr:PAS domain S-box protein [Acidobacteriota bacterium]
MTMPARLQTNALYRELFNSSPDGILLIDAQTQGVIEFNDAAYRQLGYTREEFARLRISDYEASQTPEETASHVRRALRDGHDEFETTHRTKAGVIRNIHVWAKAFDLEGRRAFHAIFRDITRHEEAEAHRRVMAEMLDTAPSSITVHDRQGRFLFANRKTYAIHGYDEREFMALNLRDLDVPESAALIEERMRAIAEQGEASFEVVHRRKDGTTFPLHVFVKNVDWQGAPALLSIATDVTDARRAEAEIVGLHRAVESSGDVIFLTDRDGTFTYVNPAFARVYGFPAAEVVGQATPRILKSGVMTSKNYADFWTMLLSGQVVQGELVNKTKDGRAIVIESSANPVFDDGGNIVGFLGVQRDITERKQSERSIQEAQQRFQAVFDGSLDGIAIVRDGVHVLVNRAHAAMFGYEPQEVVGKRTCELVVPEDRARIMALDAEIEAGSVMAHATEFGGLRKDGTTFPAEITIGQRVLQGESFLIGIVRDVTERKRADVDKAALEAQFQQAQKMESVGRLASGIAHDFNNLLTVINGMSELVLAQVSHDSRVQADVQEIAHAGERAARLTRQLLAFSRQQILEPRVLDVNTVVVGMESLLRRLLGEDIDLLVVPAPGLGHAKVDPGQIEQVISNLAVNARDAMPQGGRLTIETGNVTIAEASAAQRGEAVPPGSYVRLAVTDSGVGMDEDTRARIYEPFFTTKAPGKGTGLGLSTVYGIIKQSGGFIEVESEVGRGTSFKVYLPQVAKAVGTDRVGPTEVTHAGTETILIVEDDAGLRKLATRVLAPAGYHVLGAASGEEALGLLERHEGPVHLLLSDVVMPGMNGRQLAERLVPARPRMKVLFMSGYTDDTIVRHGVSDAEMPFLSKPFTSVALLQKVREVLDSHA